MCGTGPVLARGLSKLQASVLTGQVNGALQAAGRAALRQADVRAVLVPALTQGSLVVIIAIGAACTHSLTHSPLTRQQWGRRLAWRPVLVLLGLVTAGHACADE